MREINNLVTQLTSHDPSEQRTAIRTLEIALPNMERGSVKKFSTQVLKALNGKHRPNKEFTYARRLLQVYGKL